MSSHPLLTRLDDVHFLIPAKVDVIRHLFGCVCTNTRAFSTLRYLIDGYVFVPLSGFSPRRRVPGQWTSASLYGTNTLEKPIDRVVRVETSSDFGERIF